MVVSLFGHPAHLEKLAWLNVLHQYCWRMIRKLMLALCVGMLCSCASAKLEPKKYICTDKSMTVVSVNYGGLWGPLCAYSADGIHACREVHWPKTDKKKSVVTFPLTGQQEVTPTSDQWRSFWEKVERLKVSKWRPAYRAKDIGVTVYEGLQWGTKYSTWKGSRETKGDNAYPSTTNPDRMTLDQDAFDRLLEAYTIIS